MVRQEGCKDQDSSVSDGSSASSGLIVKSIHYSLFYVESLDNHFGRIPPVGFPQLQRGVGDGGADAQAQLVSRFGMSGEGHPEGDGVAGVRRDIVIHLKLVGNGLRFQGDRMEDELKMRSRIYLAGGRRGIGGIPADLVDVVGLLISKLKGTYTAGNS